MILSISSEVKGSDKPEAVPSTEVLQNGDFSISSDAPDPKRSKVKTGDGKNETTRWTFDFSSEANWPFFFSIGASLQSARLILSLRPRSALITTDYVAIDAEGFDVIRPATFGSLKVKERARVEVELMAEGYETEKIRELLTETGGLIPMRYADDSIVSYAKLELSFDVSVAIGNKFNVKHFGAVGDGETNDYEAIQRALDAMAAEEICERDLYFPPGNYRLLGNQSLRVPSNSTIKGSGKTLSVIQSSASIVFDAREKENVGFEHLGIALTGTRNFATGINVDQAACIVVQHCAIFREIEPSFGETIHAILARGASDVRIVHNQFRFTQVKLAGAVLASQRCYVKHNHFDSPYNFAISSVGVDTGSSQDIYIQHNIIENVPSNGGIFLGTDGLKQIPVATFENIYVENNVIKGEWSQISEKKSSTVGILIILGKKNRNIHLKNNRIDNTPFDFTTDPNTINVQIGITDLAVATDLDGLFVHHNTFDKNAKWGLRLFPGDELSRRLIKNVYIESNTCSGNRGLETFLAGNCRNINIKQNSFDNSYVRISQLEGTTEHLAITHNHFENWGSTSPYLQISREAAASVCLSVCDNHFAQNPAGTPHPSGMQFVEPASEPTGFFGKVTNNQIFLPIPFVNQPEQLCFEDNVFSRDPKSPTPPHLHVLHTNTGNASELVTELPLTRGGPFEKRVLFSQELTDVQQDEIIQVLCQFETTNDSGYNVMVASQVILTDDPSALTGLEITEASGFNVTSNMHHGKTVEVGTIQSPEAFPTAYVNVIAYAASTAAYEGEAIRVDQDYGRLSVLRFQIS